MRIFRGLDQVDAWLTQKDREGFVGSREEDAELEEVSAWVESAAARAHHQSIQRRKPHRRRNASACFERAHARAVAQVSDNRSPLSRSRIDGRQNGSDVRVG